MGRSSYEGLDRPTTPSVFTRSNRLISAEHHRTSIVQQRGRDHGRGTPAWTMWPIARSMPAFRQGQPRTNKRKCGTQPANQSLITDVFRSRPHPCTIYRPDPQPTWQQEGDQLRAQRLTRDIRVHWHFSYMASELTMSAPEGAADSLVGLIGFTSTRPTPASTAP